MPGVGNEISLSGDELSSISDPLGVKSGSIVMSFTWLSGAGLGPKPSPGATVFLYAKVPCALLSVLHFRLSTSGDPGASALLREGAAAVHSSIVWAASISPPSSTLLFMVPMFVFPWAVVMGFCFRMTRTV